MYPFSYEILLFFLFLLCLMLSYRSFLKWSWVSFVLILLGLYWSWTGQESYIGWNYQEGGTEWMRNLLLVITLIIGSAVIQKKPDHLFLIVLILLSSFLLISTDHLLMLYLALELQTFILFILIAYPRSSLLSQEAALKYFILGAVSSALLLLGISLAYGNHLDLSLSQLFFLTEGSSTSYFIQSLILMALLFKLTAVPFHYWAPDVYEGAATSIVLLVATLPKISVLAVLIHILPSSPLLILSASLSLIWGTLGALNQTKIKRLLAYSGMTHIGFILFGISLASIEGLQATYIYLFIYLIMLIVTFILLLGQSQRSIFLIELAGLAKENKVTAATWALLWLSIAGIPPLAGFVSKWYILLAGIHSHYYFFTLLIIVCSIVAAAYYLRIVKMIYFQPRDHSLIWFSILHPTVCSSWDLLLGGGSYFLFFFLCHPQPWILLCHWGVIQLY